MFWLKNKKSLLIGFLTAILLAVGFFVVAPAMAQVNTGIEFGKYTGLVDTDIRIIVAKIIRVALSLLGIIVLAYTVYGGYIYLTAGGDADKVKSAKKVLLNAVIGVVIILSALSITQFIISRLTGAIIGDNCAQNPTECVDCVADPQNPKCLTECQKNPSSCPVAGQVFYATVAPQGNVPIYNVVLDVQFSSAFGDAVVDRNTINGTNIGVFKKLSDGRFESTSYPINFEFKTDSKVAIHPVGACGEGITANDCFEKDTTYKLILSTSIKSIGGASLNCSSTHSCESLLATGNRYDALAPNVSMVLPGNWAIVGDNRNTSVSANYSDDSGVKGVAFYFKDNQNASTVIHDFLLNPFEVTGSREYNSWVPHLQDSTKSEIGEIFPTAFDLDNHRTTSTAQKVKIVPAYCFNGVLDADKGEQQVGIPAGVAPDCGKTSQCGACTGDFCDTNFDCAGTFCDISTHKCVARPKILNVSPLGAGPGSLVSVLGTNFGATLGEVRFNGVSAPVVACPLTGNNPSWYDNVVIVRVPNAGTSGPLELQKTGYGANPTNLAYFDRTDDDWGFSSNFTVTSAVLPGLSCVAPKNEAPFNSISIVGENLGINKGIVKFADLPVTGSEITNWQNDGKGITVRVPRMPAQTLSLGAVTLEGLTSNFLPFVVNPISETILPTINYVDPSNGPVGTYVTIAGRNFGETGSVIFKLNPTDPSGIIADLPPTSCGNVWSSTQIIVKVPQAIDLGSDTFRDYFVQVKTIVGDSNTQKFTVNKEPIKPGLCKIIPSSGPAATEVIFYGERFGGIDRGAVEYWQSVTSSFALLVFPQTWADLQIKDKIPANAKTGAVKIWSEEESLYSNSLNFKVQNCKDELNSGKPLAAVCGGIGEKCCGNGTCNVTCPEETVAKSSMFAWSFTSGQFPVIPRVLERCGKFCVGTSKVCSANQDCSGLPAPSNVCQLELPSPSPATKWPNSNAVCVNAQVNVLFNTAVSNNGAPLSANSQETFFVYRCLDDSCSLNNLSQVVSGNYNYNFTLNDRIFFTPTNQFATGTSYQAIVTTRVRSLAGDLEANMPSDSACPNIGGIYPGQQATYCFKFKTSNTNALCKIGGVVVTPVNYATTTLNVTLNNFYNATPLADGNNCVGLNSSAYDWRWNPSDESGDNLTPALSSSITNKDTNGDGKVDAVAQDLKIKLQETVTPEIISATWNDDPEYANFNDKIKGLAYLSLLPQRPRIADYYPKCNSACTNAEVSFEFDIPVKEIQTSFYECSNADCSSHISAAWTYSFIDNQIIGGTPFSRGLRMYPDPALKKNTLYKVIVWSKGVYGAKSVSNATLDPRDINEGTTGFSWLFRTKDDATLCAINSVEMSPASATVNVIGEIAQYYSLPKGSPDACSPNGQILKGSVYDWSWTSANTGIATVSRLDRGPRLSGSKSATAYCGNGNVDPGEDCDSLTGPCGINCRFIGKGTDACSATAKVQCCGNGGAPEFNEDCDEGILNGTPAGACSFNCLRKDYPISLNYCLAKNTTITDLALRKADCLGKWGAVSVCGNGGNLEDGEECDLGAGNNIPGSTCSDKCLLKAISFGTTASNSCGNKIVEGSNNEQCDGEIGCGMDCRWDFKGDGKIDPNQYAKAIGLTTPDSNNQQKTQIRASTSGKTGLADFILQCGFQPVDSGCPAGDLDKGAGTDSCCHLRPRVLDDRDGTWPRASYNSGICPNAKISIRFDQEMNESSFTSTTLGYYNIILAEATSTPTCPAGTYRVGYKAVEPKNWWQKIKFTVSDWFGLPAQADYYCAGGVDYELATSVDTQIIGSASSSSTVVSLILKKSLATNKKYRLLAVKDSSSAYNVKMQNPWFIDFTTANQICKINQLSIDPSVYNFKTSLDNPADNDPANIATFDTVEDGDKIFTAKPEFVNSAVIGAPAQELLNMPGSYNWSYSWVDGDLPPPDIINVDPFVGTNQARITALGKNGDTAVGAKVTIIEDKSNNSTVGNVFSATGTISVFLCNNPWPSGNPAPGLGLGYFDALENNNNVAAGIGWSNFKLIYCRDAGETYTSAGDLNISDDLGALVLNPPLYHLGDSSGIFKEFFFTFTPSANPAKPSNKNSIGLRVYPNTNHLSIADWYKSQPWIPKGAPVVAKVGADDHVYEALQEGRTYYINGLNINGNNVFTNVYVLAFSDNPTSETLNIIPQLLNNFTLNVNETSKPKIASLMRDFTRFKDLKLMSDKLAAGYNSKGFFPQLTESTQYGTYLPAYTNSKWQSWQLLGNSLGFGMPNDPINQFYGCGSSTLTVGASVNLGPYDPVTCWNAANSTFVCPTGSHLYQYATKGGIEATIKSDFEVTDAIWLNDLTNILNVKLCSKSKSTCATNADCYQQKCVENKCELDGAACATDANCPDNTCSGLGVNFETQNSCNNSVQGIGGLCGDGIVGQSEWCEIGQTQYDSCAPTEDSTTPINESLYPGKLLKKCNNSCSAFVAIGSCVMQGKCGDGLKQGPELCDDGSNNGKYGYCNSNCSSRFADFCGNKQVDVGKEVCDFSSVAHPSPAQYNIQKTSSCGWDCQSFDYCGDGKINTLYEECEASESCQVGRCSSNSPQSPAKYCEKDSDCQVGITCSFGCLQFNPITQTCMQYGPTKFCVNGPKNGQACGGINDCLENVKCENYESGKRYCKVTDEQKYIRLFKNGYPYFEDATSTASLNPPAVLKYSDTNKTCKWERFHVASGYFASTTLSCLPFKTPEIAVSQLNCGKDGDNDGNYKDPGEECDFGPANGSLPSTPGYNQTASYCTLGCKQATISGGFCGNNKVDGPGGTGDVTGPEICDGSMMVSGFGNRFCISPDFTQKTTLSNTSCNMSSCSSFSCPQGWIFCKDTTECPAVNIVVRDVSSANTKDDIFSVEIDGQKIAGDIIPTINVTNTNGVFKNTLEYPAKESLNLLNVPKGAHTIKIYNRTGGMSGTGQITYSPSQVDFGLPLEAFSSPDYEAKWTAGGSTLTIDPTKQNTIPATLGDIRFTITLPKECGSYWNNWLNIFDYDKIYNETQYPCVNDSDQPGYIMYKFQTK